MISVRADEIAVDCHRNFKHSFWFELQKFFANLIHLKNREMKMRIVFVPCDS